MENSSEFVHWLFHYSHDKIASMESFKNKVIDHYNYGLLLVIDSDKSNSKNINKQAVANLKSVAEDIRDKMMVSYCDISRSQICREIMVMFELEDHEFPLVRMLYRMKDDSPEEIGEEQIFYKFTLDRNSYKDLIDEIQNGENTNGIFFYIFDW